MLLNINLIVNRVLYYRCAKMQNDWVFIFRCVVQFAEIFKKVFISQDAYICFGRFGFAFVSGLLLTFYRVYVLIFFRSFFGCQFIIQGRNMFYLIILYFLFVSIKSSFSIGGKKSFEWVLSSYVYFFCL